MKPKFIILLLFFSCRGLSAQKVFDFNADCQKAYQEILKLKIVSGQALINVEKKKNPENLIPYLLENYIDFFILFFNEDPAEYKKRSGNREKRLALLSDGPEDSPWYLFSKAVIHFHWAVVRIKFGYNWDAGWEFRRSFIQVKDNGKKYETFLPNKLYQGAMQVAAGTIPDGYKWLSNMLGIRGSIQSGMQQLKTFLNSPDPFAQLYHDEAVFYYCYLSYYIENDKEGVLQFVRDQKLDLKNNHLFAYLAANLSTHNYQAESALEILHNRNNSPGYLQTPVWDLEEGYILLYKGSSNAAEYLERFTRDFKGRYYVKDALQKISWHYYLQGNQSKADYFRQQILKRGTSNSEADKQAQDEALTNRWSNSILLRARLYSDGGYHQEALRLLHGKSANDFANPEEKLEFNYRVGRIYDEMGRDTEALAFYKRTVDQGKMRHEYYAARAALQIAFIYEEQHQYSTALDWFRTCIDMKDHEFKNSIDQRAKAGIDRCTVK
jgi:predicted negative regulator of RcsB-dependent stress response